jgi:hypothetical protein
VISAHQRLGFRFRRSIEIRSIPYLEQVLDREAFDPTLYEDILQRWQQRGGAAEAAHS